VYARADFEAVYGRSVEALAEEWQAWLRAVPVVDRTTEALVTRRFARPSLFERRCPHYVPPYRRALEAGQAALARGDTTEALRQFERAATLQPRSVEGQAAWARLQLGRGEARPVADRLDTLDFVTPVPVIELLQGDASALLGRPDSARRHYRFAREHYPRYAHDGWTRLLLREAVADRPDVVRVLASSDSARVQARRLERLPDASPAVPIWRAIRLMEAEDFAMALDVWNSIPPLIDSTGAPWDHPALRRQIGWWKATTALRLERWSRAEQYASETAEAFRAVGALNLAHQLDDLARKARWLQAAPPHTFRRSAAP
jgi:tetratricopeptide (TPR) repeat protein